MHAVVFLVKSWLMNVFPSCSEQSESVLSGKLSDQLKMPQASHIS